MRIKNLAVLMLSFLLLGILGCQTGDKGETKVEEKQLRVLAWVGYEESEIVKPFEERYGVEVLTETFTGADKMFAKLSQSPDSYDVVVVDPEYIAKLHKADLLAPLDEADFDFSGYIKPFQDFETCKVNGRLYAVIVRFGINGIVYNTDRLTKEEVSSYNILWSEKVVNKVGIWDWYLPSMGVLALGMGYQPPYQLAEQELNMLEEKMKKLRPSVRTILSNFSEINEALAREDIWLIPALGEHTAAILAEQGHPIDWVVPKEGAIMWVETLGIPPESKNKKLAIKYIQYMQEPKTQSLLTWRRAYRSNIPSSKGIDLLTDEQKELLKVRDGNEAEELVNSVFVRSLPRNSSDDSGERRWQNIWQKFKSESH